MDELYVPIWAVSVEVKRKIPEPFFMVMEPPNRPVVLPSQVLPGPRAADPSQSGGGLHGHQGDDCDQFLHAIPSLGQTGAGRQGKFCISEKNFPIGGMWAVGTLAVMAHGV